MNQAEVLNSKKIKRPNPGLANKIEEIIAAMQQADKALTAVPITA